MNTMRLVLLGLLALAVAPARAQFTLPGTTPLTATNDLAAAMVAGLDRYLDRVTAAAATNRARWWRYDTSSNDAFLSSLLAVAETNRARLREILGVVDRRDPPALRFTAPAGTNFTAHPGEVARGPGYRVFAVGWDVFRGVTGEGLLVVPDGEPTADVIAVPDCDWTPEQALGLAPGVPAGQQFPRRFAEAGCRVLVPALVDRGSRFAGNPGVRSVKHSQRETLWRAAYQMGRQPLGHEIQSLLAAADWLDATRTAGPRTNGWPATLERIQNPGGNRQELGIVGYGEGGLLAFYAGAVDPRFLAVGVCGAFGLSPRNAELPIYRNAWSLLDRFGDAEVAAMILPRALLAEHGRYPEVTHTDEGGGAPGRLWRPTQAEFTAEHERLNGRLPELPGYFLLAGEDSVCDWGTAQRFYRKLASTGGISQTLGPAPAATAPLPDDSARTLRLYHGILEDTQHLMRESEYARREFWKQADFKSLAAFSNSSGWYRDYFRSNVVGIIPPASLPPNPRSRLLYETNGIRGYEVMLDVHPDVFAHGILVLPRGLESPPRRRPVVVCQHGLEGRPTDVADPRVQHDAYHRYAFRLAERGFVTFAPQNPYIGGTTFRQVLRKAQPLGLTLWSFMVRQHEVITDWLAAQAG